MNSINLICWAQSLDNVSADHIEENGTMVDSGNKSSRQKIVSQISRVTSKGNKAFSDQVITIYLLRDEFLIDLPAEQKDIRGRTAPIICCGNIPQEWSEEWPASVISRMEAFAKRIDRSISSEHTEIAMDMLTKINQKKNDSSQLLPLIGKIGIIIAFLICLLLLLRR